MPGPPARVRAALLFELEAYCTARGLQLTRLMARVGIDPACLATPNELVPLNDTMALFDRVARELEDPYFGLSFAREFKPGASGLAGAIVITAPTVREALRQLARLVTAYSPQVTAEFIEQDGVGALRWTNPDTITAPRRHYGIFSAASIVWRLREGMVSDRWRPLSIEFDHHAPPGLGPYREIFGERMKFERPSNRIVVDGATLGRPMRTANPALHALALDLARRWIDIETDRASMASSVRSVLSAELTRGAPTLDVVARSLGLSVSQLQWRLDQEGTSFEKVLSGMRADMAEHLLKNTDKSISEIAYALGFADPSTFSRAARRWFSDTPLNIRRKVRRGEAVGG